MRWSKQDWIALALAKLKHEDAAALTLEGLCSEAGRTRGSFYHHFESVESLLIGLAEAWCESETEAIASQAEAEADPVAALAKLARLTEAIDHRLERGIRVLGMTHPAIHRIVETSDRRREKVMARMMIRAYGLARDDASHVARLLHALHQTAVMRAPTDIKSYSRATIRALLEWLPKREDLNPYA